MLQLVILDQSVSMMYMYALARERTCMHMHNVNSVLSRPSQHSIAPHAFSIL